jgi:hypothetical protein
MERFLVCDNSKCRFILDNRINGRGSDRSQFMLKHCPECGGNWSSSCPSCSREIALKFVGGLPHFTCCDGTAQAKAKARAA